MTEFDETIRVSRGAADSDELAALTVVLLARIADTASADQGDDDRMPGWRRRATTRSPVPGSWCQPVD